MQRDIKFDLIYKGETRFHHKKYHLSELMCGISKICDIHRMMDLVATRQFTCLKGKNGVEIYEGDIVDDHVGRGVVVWWQRNAAFKVSYIGENSGKGKWFADYLDSELKTIKVIGNIYENPELLGEEK